MEQAEGPRPLLVAVSFPCPVPDAAAARRMLPNLDQILAGNASEPLSLRLRPDDPSAIPIQGFDCEPCLQEAFLGAFSRVFC